MPSIGLHHILSCIFDVEFSDYQKALSYQQRLVRLIRERLMQEAEDLLDSLSLQQDLLLIEQLEVDIGEIQFSKIESELPTLFKRKLEEAIMRLLQEAEEGNTEAIEFVPMPTSKLELLLYFLRTGQVYWWVDNKKDNLSVQELWYDVQRSAPRRFSEEITLLFKEPIPLQRFLYHFSEKEVKNFLRFLSPSYEPLVTSILEHHAKLTKVFNITPQAFFQWHYSFLLPYLLEQRHQKVDVYRMLSELYAHLAQKINVSLPILIEKIPTISNEKSPIYSAKKAIEEVFTPLAVKVGSDGQEAAAIYPEEALDLWRELLEKGRFVSREIPLKKGLPIVWNLLLEYWKEKLVIVLRYKWSSITTQEFILKQLSPQQLESLVRSIVPQRAKFIISLQKKLLQKRKEISLLNANVLWKSTLSYLLLEYHGKFETVFFIKNLVLQIARQTSTTVQEILNVLDTITGVEQIIQQHWISALKKVQEELAIAQKTVEQWSGYTTLEDKLAAFRYFLTHGFFPMPIQTGFTREETELMIWELLEQKAEEVALLLVEINFLENTRLFHRISHQFSTELAQTLLSELLPIEDEIAYLKHVFSLQIKEKDWLGEYLQTFFPSYEFSLEDIEEVLEELARQNSADILTLLLRLQGAEDSQLVVERKRFAQEFAVLMLQRTQWGKKLPPPTFELSLFSAAIGKPVETKPSDEKEQLLLDTSVPLMHYWQLFREFFSRKKFPEKLSFSLSQLFSFLNTNYPIELQYFVQKLPLPKRQLLEKDLQPDQQEILREFLRSPLLRSHHEEELIRFLKAEPSILSVSQVEILLQEWMTCQPKQIYEQLQTIFKGEKQYRHWIKLLPPNILKKLSRLILPTNHEKFSDHVERLWKALVLAQSDEVYVVTDEKKKYELVFSYLLQYPSKYAFGTLLQYFLIFLENELRISDKMTLLKIIEHLTIDEGEMEKELTSVVERFVEDSEQEEYQKSAFREKYEKLLREHSLTHREESSEIEQLKKELKQLQTLRKELEKEQQQATYTATEEREPLFRSIEGDIEQKKNEKLKYIQASIEKLDQKIENILKRLQNDDSLPLEEKVVASIQAEIQRIEKSIEEIKLKNEEVKEDAERKIYQETMNLLYKKLAKLKIELDVRKSLNERKLVIEDEIASAKYSAEVFENELVSMLEQLSEYDDLLKQVADLEGLLQETEQNSQRFSQEISQIEKDLQEAEKEVLFVLEKEKTIIQEKAVVERLKEEISEIEQRRTFLSGRIAQLQTDTTTNQTKIEAIRTAKDELQALEQQLASLVSEKENREKQITVLEKNISLLQECKIHREQLHTSFKKQKQHYQELLFALHERKEKLKSLHTKITQLEKIADEYVASQEEKQNLEKFIEQKAQELTQLTQQLQKEQLEDKFLQEQSELLLKEAKKRRQQQLRRSSKTSPKAIEEPKFVKNAGLVLVHPFLLRLFRLLKLVKGVAFVDESSQQRAVHLLQYIAYKTEKTSEYHLVLNKFLCGIPFETPIQMDIQLTEEEMNTCESMIRGVIQNWNILKNTSNDNFRVSFLHREGKLMREKLGGWKLKVEKKGIDVLMEKLSWEIKIIRLPWMSEPLYVEW